MSGWGLWEEPWPHPPAHIWLLHLRTHSDKRHGRCVLSVGGQAPTATTSPGAMVLGDHGRVYSLWLHQAQRK